MTTIAWNAIVIGLWLCLFRPIYDNLATIFTREDFRTNQVALLGVLVLIGLRLRRAPVRLNLAAAPRFHVPALALAAAGAMGFTVVERFLDVNVVAMCLFGLASYGLIGLWMPPDAWRRGLPAALLLVAVLPFGDLIDVFVGYPMRIATATAVRDGLAAAGVGSYGIDTILVFENGITQVDLPCSGVKSLWTGALFLLAATWIERRPINLRWLAVALVSFALLFVANLARVASLVIVGQVLGARLLAEMMHAPLGVLGFAGACAASALLLRRLPAHDAASGAANGWHANTARGPGWLAPALAGCLAALSLAGGPPAPGSPAAADPALAETWNFPAELATTPVPLQPGSLDWLMRDGAESVTRLRFDWRGITGSLLLVPSTNWRAHHNPERCFETDGLTTESSLTSLVDGDLPVRSLNLTDRQRGARHAAVYWFQSATRVTDDYGTRLWSALSPAPVRWVLVSVLFDEPHDAQEANAEGLLHALRGAVRARLAESPGASGDAMERKR